MFKTMVSCIQSLLKALGWAGKEVVRGYRTPDIGGGILANVPLLALRRAERDGLRMGAAVATLLVVRSIFERQQERSTMGVSDDADVEERRRLEVNCFLPKRAREQLADWISETFGGNTDESKEFLSDYVGDVVAELSEGATPQRVAIQHDAYGIVRGLPREDLDGLREFVHSWALSGDRRFEVPVPTTRPGDWRQLYVANLLIERRMAAQLFMDAT